ncbi:hypothetical protein [Nocardia gipuzkoensis]|uniref:hypothetical protein n=1 Tax=Nocardia gipuzkoensis TaxID=2749991 RepID=UPI0024559CAC|nr:hypothetical protein [Nocardia gipuzkoensis]
MGGGHARGAPAPLPPDRRASPPPPRAPGGPPLKTGGGGARARVGAGPRSPVGGAAAATQQGITDVAALIRDCASGRELADGGFAQDVAVATELDVSSVVPVLTEGAFADAAG